MFLSIMEKYTLAQKGHTCKLKMLLQIKNSTCKLKIVHANQKYYPQIKYSTCKLKIVLQTENRKHIDAN